MPRSNVAPERSLARELASVEEAAGARLKAETDGDREAAGLASEGLLVAATSAMAVGYSLREIASAEDRGKVRVREELHDDALKHVERTGRHLREAGFDHHRAIARAVRLGLSMREIALAAGVTHSTIRAISNRLVGEGGSGDPDASPPADSTANPESEVTSSPSRK